MTEKHTKKYRRTRENVLQWNNSISSYYQKHKTWLHNTILTPLQGKKSVKEVVLNQLRKDLKADTQSFIQTNMFLENWSATGTNFKKYLHHHLSLSNRTSLLRGMPGSITQCSPPSWEHIGHLHTMCCCPRSTPQHHGAVGQTRLQQFQSIGRAAQQGNISSIKYKLFSSVQPKETSWSIALWCSEVRQQGFSSASVHS